MKGSAAGRDDESSKGAEGAVASTLVCFAVKEEARAIKDFAEANPSTIRVLLTGMGRRNAERAIRAALSSDRPGLVVSAGYAGGLDPALKSGDVVFAAENLPNLAKVLEAAGAIRARFHCAEKVATTVAQKVALREKTGANAVEMESGIICSVCAEQGIACATVRVILDSATEDLPLDFNQLMTPDDRLDNRKLALRLLKQPGKVGALLRLQNQTTAATRRLGEVLRRLLVAGAAGS